MAQATSGDTVKVHYTGRLKDGTVFDSSEGRDPLEFKLGEGSVIPGFERAVEGLSPGESATVNIAPEDAYGPRHEDRVQVVERSGIPDEIELEIGIQLAATSPDGEQLIVTVTEIADDTVTIDANHPLAGHELVFDLELVEIGPRIIT